MVSQRTVRRFEEMGGYDIVEKARKGWATWGIKSLLVEKTKISYPMILEIERDQPVRPTKTQLVYVTEFQKSRGYEVIKEKYGRRRDFKDIERNLLRAFHFLGDTEPIFWGSTEWRKVWDNPEFLDPQTNFIQNAMSIDLRNCMRAFGKHDFLDEFLTKKREKGQKRQNYLEDDDVEKMILIGIVEVDVLLIFYLGITAGGRISSLCATLPEKVSYELKAINMFERKMVGKGKAWVMRFFQPETLSLLRQFIMDFGIKPQERIFRWSEKKYSEMLKAAGERAGTRIRVTSHVLKHTFVSQASKRGVSLDTVSDQTGTDPTTLKEYYMAENVPKRRAELLGEKYEVEPFGTWVKKLHPLIQRRYAELKDKCVLVNGIRRLETPREPRKAAAKRKPRKINWAAIEKMLTKFDELPADQKEKVPQRRVVPFWKRALSFHRQGLSDSQAIEKARQ